MPLPFEFVIAGPPVSQQARRSERRQQWQQSVRDTAHRHWGDDAPFTGAIMVAITYFYDRISLDIDNIPKPILDALKRLVYADDAVITDLLCRKRNRNDNFQFQNTSAILTNALDWHHEFLHIVVDNAPNQEDL